METLILKELDCQPDSYLEKLVSGFEITSVINVSSKDQLKAVKSRPTFNSTFIVIFRSVSMFKSNIPFLKMEWMFPVILCQTASAVADAKALCIEKGIPYKLWVHEFDKEEAKKMIYSLASKQVSESFVSAVISQVGLSPRRILSAMSICSAVGYSANKVKRYVDKYRYTDVHDAILSILGIARPRQFSRFLYNTEVSIPWFKSYKKSILSEFDTLVEIYQDILDGKISSATLQEYLESSRRTRYEVVWASNLFDKISIIDLKFARESVASCRSTLDLLNIVWR